jgi:hypothetical protein
MCDTSSGEGLNNIVDQPLPAEVAPVIRAQESKTYAPGRSLSFCRKLLRLVPPSGVPRSGCFRMAETSQNRRAGCQLRRGMARNCSLPDHGSRLLNRSTGRGESDDNSRLTLRRDVTGFREAATFDRPRLIATATPPTVDWTCSAISSSLYSKTSLSSTHARFFGGRLVSQSLRDHYRLCNRSTNTGTRIVGYFPIWTYHSSFGINPDTPALEVKASIVRNDRIWDGRREGCSRRVIRGLPEAGPIRQQPSTRTVAFSHMREQYRCKRRRNGAIGPRKTM